MFGQKSTVMANYVAKILVVDDERSVRKAIKELLELENYTVDVAEDGLEALAMIKKSPDYDLIITDVLMPKMDGLELLINVKENFPTIVVLVVSGHGTISQAVDCVKSGAYNFIPKPIEMNALLITVRNGLDAKDKVQQIKVLKKKVSRFGEMIGKSAAISKVKDMITKIAMTDSRVLITGDNGTGKELVAHQIHDLSLRSSGAFVAVNCAAIPGELIESELFGHEKGAFTSAIKTREGKFEQAQGGTIFLDEIGDMSLSAQAKVLRVLQENIISRVGSDKEIKVSVRVLCATNKDLNKEIKAGRFREDLYHRLSVIIIEVPALAKRREDIPLLVNFFLKQITEEQGSSRKQIAGDAMDALMNDYSWSGNIRELRNVVERLMILGDNPISIANVTEYVK